MDLHITGTSPGSLLPIFIVIANKSKAEANSRFFNMNGRPIVMKSTDKFVLVLVASLSLLFAGCGGGGGSSSMTDTDMTDTDMTDTDMTDTDMTDTDMTDTDTASAPSQAELEGLTQAIADPDGDGKVPESDDNELTKRRPGESIHLMTGGRLAVGGTDFASGDELGENDTNVANSVEFQKMSESRIDLSGGYEASVYQRTKSNKMDTLTVYSNVEAAGSVAFNDYSGWAAGLTAGSEGDTQSDATKVVYDVITIGTGVVSKVVDKMSGEGIPPSAGTNRETDAGEMFAGTLYGIPGKYSCATGTDCTLTRDSDGILTVTGTFSFTANPTNVDTEDSHVIAGADPDTDYLVLGYWLQESANDKYGVSVFAKGSLPFADITTVATGGALQGTATYDGSATGMYAQKDLEVVNGETVGTPAAVGQFSADVSLTAHFGNTASPAVNGSDKISAAELNTISGTIDNFQNAAGNMISSNWVLKLNAASIGALTDASRIFSDTTGEGSSMGQWDGAFYGSAVNNPTGDSQTADNYPSSVAGRFTGHFQDGHVIGAFGAATQ